MAVVVYLDQNMWIQVARVINGKEHSPELAKTVDLLRSDSVITPLSHVHYLESARIADPGRRERLGQVLWAVSGGVTTAAFRTVVVHELENALAERTPHVIPRSFAYLGFGAEHAFGLSYGEDLPRRTRHLFEKSLVTGEKVGGSRAPGFFRREFANSFQTHLEKLNEIKSELPQDRWLPALYAISLADISEPLYAVFQTHDIGVSFFDNMSENDLKHFVDEMPTRRIDVHLHHQVLNNDQYRPKRNDLEDWAGLSVASMYCDVVVCEKHFASIAVRGDFATRAKMLTRLEDLPGALMDA